ncbi:MAG: glycosyltransferase family 2 protein [Candidatus Omnitrophica bacterium]|nr:glycosyltransferase family 2 protein [Candidatus Omnitrophota bacterium]MDD5591955.1 glycosyltransferase family 2 protein [Candidatus Omnitrophota bacterium]
MKLSIVLPAHNEEENITEVVRRIENSSLDIPYELVVVNDHSTDNTIGLLGQLCRQYNNIKVVDNALAKGFANALKTGFKSADTEVVVPVMADLCDDLDTLKKMFKRIDEGYDIVCGCRYIKGGARQGGSKLKGFFSCFAGRSLSFLLGLPTHDIANAFKMYKKKVIDSIEIKSQGFEISMEIPLKAYFLGFKITEVPTAWKERTRGKSSFKMFKLLPAYLRLYIWAVFKKMIG